MGMDVSIAFLFDLTQAEARHAEMQGKIDAQQKEWEAKRRQILTEMRNIAMGMSLMVSIIRTTVRVTKQTLSPLQNALLSMISSTTSLMVATAAAMTTSSLGVLAGAAMYLAAFAFGFQLAESAKIIAAQDEVKVMFAAVQARLADLQGSIVMFGGSL